jgi:hypothetical protein
MKRFILAAALLSIASIATAAPCKTGCAIAKHGDGPLESEELQEWLQAYQESDALAPTVALETLLYHGEQVRRFMASNNSKVLDAAHRSKLNEELSKVYAVVEARLVNDEGEVVSHLQPTEVRLGEKAHLYIPGQNGRPPFEISGTVMRVGVAHLWARL